MVVKIRLARFSKRNVPFYNIVVAHARYSTPTDLVISVSMLTVLKDGTR